MYWFYALASLIVAVNAISPLTIKGTKFYDANGTQVFFKGKKSRHGKQGVLIKRRCVSKESDRSIS